MIGKRVSNYTLTARVGTGSTASVYQAVHQSLDITVAIKFLSHDLASDPVAKKRFLRGIKAVASLDHPNVCRFYEAGETDDGRLFLVMSYCDGRTLRDTLRRGRCALPEALLIATLAADGLAHAHRKGVVHRDIKPANLLLSSDSVVQIADFGLAQLMDEGILTRSSEVLGTPLYMSPEQMNGEELDARTDLFSLGSVLYQMLTGTAPFAADTTVGVMRRIGMEPHTPLSQLMPDAPASLWHVVDRALEKDRRRRYQRAEELRDDLRAVLETVSPGYAESRPLPRPPRPSWGERLRWPSWQRLSLLLVMVAALAMGHAFEPPRNMSFVVMPATATANDAAGEQAFQAGLCQDLTNRLDALFADSRSRWAVPRDRALLLEADTPQSAPALLGARHVITAAADSASGDAAQLVRYDVDPSPVHTAGVTIGLRDTFDSAALDRALARLAGLSRAGSTPGYTRSAGAYRAYLRGLGHLDAGGAEIDDAVAALQQAVTEDSTFARAWLALAECHRRRFDTNRDSTAADAVRAECARALALAPDLAGAHVTLGRLLAAQDPDAAESEFRRALQLKPRDAVALRQLGDMNFSAGRIDQAAAAYRRATDLNPSDGAAWEMLGYFYYTQARYHDAIAAFDRDAEVAPGWHQTFNFLGGCYFALDCWDRALANFEESFRLSRTYVACANLGLLYYMKRDFVNAASMYRWAREYNPTDHEITNYLAAAEYWLPDGRAAADSLYREAIVLARERRARKGDTPKLHAEMATLFAITGAPDSATTYAEQAVELAPKDPEVHYMAAMAYEDMGEREKALRYIASSLDLGQSRRRIESEPFLDQLRKDERYEVTVRDFPVQAGGCDQ